MTDLFHTYSDGITKETIGICGPLPPPLGGVAVHVSRVAEKLRAQHNHIFVHDSTRDAFFLKRLFKFFLFFLKTRPSCVQYHTLYHGLGELLIVNLARSIFRFKLMIIDHDCRDLYKRSRIFKHILNYTLKNSCLVLIGHTTAQSYSDNAIALPKSFYIESPFLPPDGTQKELLFMQYPTDLKKFLAQKYPLILINAFRLVLLDNKDLYGVDLTIEALAQLHTEFENIGLVIALASRGEKTHYQKIMARIEELHVTESIFWIENQQELWPLFFHVSLFVRPTLSDGYSVSIQEALWAGCPVIASDAASRPAKTTLFKTGDLHDYTCQLRYHLHTKPACGYQNMPRIAQ